MVNPPHDKIIYCNSEYQEIFDNYPEVDFQQGLPSMSQFNGTERTLVVIDDMMTQMDQSVSDLFTKYSQHRKISVMFLTQILFCKSKHNRNMSLNTHYLVLFKTPEIRRK
jgi:hypothetical protein